jgi:hypothetical protein
MLIWRSSCGLGLPPAFLAAKVGAPVWGGGEGTFYFTTARNYEQTFAHEASVRGVTCAGHADIIGSHTRHITPPSGAALLSSSVPRREYGVCA